MKYEMAAQATILDAKSIAQIKFYNSPSETQRKGRTNIAALFEKDREHGMLDS